MTPEEALKFVNDTKEEELTKNITKSYPALAIMLFAVPVAGTTLATILHTQDFSSGTGAVDACALWSSMMLCCLISMLTALRFVQFIYNIEKAAEYKAEEYKEA